MCIPSFVLVHDVHFFIVNTLFGTIFGMISKGFYVLFIGIRHICNWGHRLVS